MGRSAVTLTAVAVLVWALGPPKVLAVGATVDFDESGEVTFDDFFMLMDHFGQATGDPGFDPLYDADGSGSVDYGDFFILFDNLGRGSGQIVIPDPPGPGAGPYANAGAVFSLTSPTSLEDVGPDSTIEVSLFGQALVDVKQLQITLEYSPANAFDLAECSYVGPEATIAGAVLAPATARLTAGWAAYSGSGLSGMQPLGSFSLRTGGSVSPGTQVVVRVTRVAVGPTSVETDVFDEADLGLTVRLNPLVTLQQNRRLAVFPAEPYPIRVQVSPDAPSLTSLAAHVRSETTLTTLATVPLSDGGQPPDAVAGDGLYTGVWADSRSVGRYLVDLWPLDQDNVPRPVTAAASFLVGHTIATFPDSMLASPEEVAHARVPLLIEDDGSGYFSGRTFQSVAFGVNVSDLPAGGSMAADTVGSALGGLPGELASSAVWVDDGMWRGWAFSASLTHTDSLALSGGPGPVQRALAYVDMDLRPASAVPSLVSAADLTFDGQREGIARVLHSHLWVGRGDIDTSRTIDAFDASLILMHTVGKANLNDPGDALNDAVEAQYGFELGPYVSQMGDVSGQQGVTAFDASLILQREQHLITHFPTEEGYYRLWDPPAEWWDPPTAPAGKPVAAAPAPLGRRVWLGTPVRVEPGLLSLPVETDQMEGVLAGTLALRFDSGQVRPAGVRAAALTAGYLLDDHVEGSLLRVSFAGAAWPTGGGTLVDLLFEECPGAGTGSALVSLEAVQINEEAALPVALSFPLPRALALHPNYPNPFNPQTTIAYVLPAAGPVRLAIYDLLGQEVCLLAGGRQEAGLHAVVWDGRDRAGRGVASGVYLCRLQVGESLLVRKMLLLK
ncbi:MAG: FlgD immunoglobulin-like domain containing protein [Candidatus Latescibacterota bacterium]